MHIEHPNSNFNFQIGGNTLVLNAFVRALRFVSPSKLSRSVILEKSPTEAKNGPDLDAITWLQFLRLSVHFNPKPCHKAKHLTACYHLGYFFFFYRPKPPFFGKCAPLHSTNEAGFPNISVNQNR